MNFVLNSTTIILFLTNILLFIYYHLNIYFNYWRERGVPYVRPLPFFGNIKDLFFQRTSEALHYSWLYNKLDGHRFGGIYLLTKPVLLVRDPQLARRILDADVKYFSRKKYLETDQQPNPFCVLDTDVITRKLLRNKLSPIFSLNRIKKTFHVLVNYSASMSKIIETLILYESINIAEVTTRFVTDVYGYYALSFDISSMKDFSSPFHEMSRRLVKSRVSSNFLGFIHRYFPKLRFLVKCFIDHIPQNFFLRIYDAVVNLRRTNNIVKEDFLQVLIDLGNLKKYSGEANHSNQDATNPTTNIEAFDTWPQKELLGLDGRFIFTQYFLFWYAGTEMIFGILNFCLHELAMNPNVQENLREDVDSSLRRHGGELTYEAVNSMKYMDQVIYETLRKYHPDVMLNRVCSKSYTIPGTEVRIERGTQVIIPVYALNHDPQYFPDPERFYPDRFDPENKSSTDLLDFLPFGIGSRKCIGMDYAMIQMKVGRAGCIFHLKQNNTHATTHKQKFPICALSHLKIRTILIVPRTWLGGERREGGHIWSFYSNKLTKFHWKKDGRHPSVHRFHSDSSSGRRGLRMRCLHERHYDPPNENVLDPPLTVSGGCGQPTYDVARLQDLDCASRETLNLPEEESLRRHPAGDGFRQENEDQRNGIFVVRTSTGENMSE
uniref:Cytochrome P450 n=1 Tax=Timema bartmani TaxID=61472 RepID=A0A7R9HWU9_9NEOP|nr:unnamed protein product [Timema bartmani]